MRGFGTLLSKAIIWKYRKEIQITHDTRKIAASTKGVKSVDSKMSGAFEWTELNQNRKYTAVSKSTKGGASTEMRKLIREAYR